MFFVSIAGTMDEVATFARVRAEQWAEVYRKRLHPARPELVYVIEAESFSDAERQSDEYFARLADEDSREQQGWS